MTTTAQRRELPEGLLELVMQGPAVRSERVAEVTRLLASGVRTCADDVADAVVRYCRALLDVGA